MNSGSRDNVAMRLDVWNDSKPDALTLDEDSFGRLRRELIWTLGDMTAHGVMARFGLSCGHNTLIPSAVDSSFLKNFGQLVKLENGYRLTNSIEAREHKTFFGVSTLSQCWTVAGFLTGVFSLLEKHPIYVFETECVAKGDDKCFFVGDSKENWEAGNRFPTAIYEENNMAYELAITREQLQLTKDRYQNLFEQSSTPIFIIDPETGICLNANLAAEDLTGYKLEELIEMTLFDFCNANDHHKLVADMKALSNGGASIEQEIEIAHKDGHKRIIAQSNKILTYGGQHVIQSIMRDVTELKTSAQKEKDLQQQLLRSERLSSIGRLAASVAHELKNPLGAIRNAVYYIRTALVKTPIMEQDPHLKDIIKLVEEEVDSAVVIIGELLDFSRVVQIVPRRTQVNELLEKIPHVVTIPENVKVVWDLDVTLPSAMVDPQRLSQVFSNLVANAMHAMAKGGELTLKSQYTVESTGNGELNKEFVVISIQDTGSGIEPAHLAKIFEPLFTTKARGTGLGLAISSNIVEKHGGAIHVTSQVGKGTCFTVKLPMQPPEEKEGKTNEHK